MRFYCATRHIFPRNFTARVFAICFASVHIPLIAFLAVQALLGEWRWEIFLPLLIATVLGTGVAMAGLAGLLAPIRIATARLKQLQAGEPVDAIPEGGRDMAGDLLEATAHAARSTAKRIEVLRGVAYTDRLTGLYNRHGFLEMLKRRTKAGASGTLALIDGDRFKQVNDRLGHGGGDRVLRAIGNRIGESVRTSDIACRWGGDEFVIFFEGLPGDEAQAVVERIHDALLRRAPARLDGDPVTFSWGVAPLERSGRAQLDAAIALADKALYRAKQTKFERAASPAG